MANRIVHSERVFDGVKFSVDRIELTSADGATTHTREKVTHPGAVIVLPVLDDGRLVLIRNQRFVVGEELIELCAGTLEPGEPPIECAARELIEETGYKSGKLTPLTKFYTSPGFSDELMYAFLATDLTEVGQQLEPTEDIAVERFSPADVTAMIERGEITDGKTIATMLYWQAFIGQGSS